jgi:hypothetical protein
MIEPMLPAEFAELEPYAVKWCLATEPERYAERMASTMDEMQAFYETGMPRIRDAMTYLDRFPLDDLGSRELNLLRIVYSLIMVSLPVEVWTQPRVVEAGTAYFDRCTEPTP